MLDKIRQILKKDKKRAEAEGRFLTKGRAASPGAAVGMAVFSSSKAEDMGKAGTKVILVRPETSPGDINGMLASQGILCSRGDMMAHAAVNARMVHKPAVVGAEEIAIDDDEASFRVGDTVVHEGDYVSIDGNTGRVYSGEIKTNRVSLSEEDMRKYYLEKLNESWLKFGVEAIDTKQIPMYPCNVLSANLASEFGLRGPNIVIPNACAAGNYAIGYAYDFLRSQEADLMFALVEG